MGLIPSRGKKKVFLFSSKSKAGSGLQQPPIQCIPTPLTPRPKQRERAADHLPPTSAKAMNAWSNISTTVCSFTTHCTSNQGPQRNAVLEWNNKFINSFLSRRKSACSITLYDIITPDNDRSTSEFKLSSFF